MRLFVERSRSQDQRTKSRCGGNLIASMPRAGRNWLGNDSDGPSVKAVVFRRVLYDATQQNNHAFITKIGTRPR